MWRGGAGGGGRGAAGRPGLPGGVRVSVGLRWLPGEPVTTKGAEGGGCGGLAEISRVLGCARRRRPRLPLAGQYSFGGPGRAGGARCSAAPCRPLVFCALDPSLGGRGAGGEGGARGRRRVGWGRWQLGRGRGQRGRPRGAGTPAERPVEVGSALREKDPGNRESWERGTEPH